MDVQRELVAEFDREVVSTRKMLDAIPADADLTWKANPKSMTLGRLAGHTAETAGDWAVATRGFFFQQPRNSGRRELRHLGTRWRARAPALGEPR